jgi:hypothetical protein
MFSLLIVTSSLLNDGVASVNLLDALLELGLHLLDLGLENVVGVVKLFVLIF